MYHHLCHARNTDRRTDQTGLYIIDRDIVRIDTEHWKSPFRPHFFLSLARMHDGAIATRASSSICGMPSLQPLPEQERGDAASRNSKQIGFERRYRSFCRPARALSHFGVARCTHRRLTRSPRVRRSGPSSGVACAIGAGRASDRCICRRRTAEGAVPLRIGEAITQLGHRGAAIYHPDAP